MLVREMRGAAKLSQAQLAERAGTTQSVIARLEDAEYTAHSLHTLEKIAAACGVSLTLHAQKKPKLELEVSLVS
jgi:transcriptional regulator with XRE-family HTH domain